MYVYSCENCESDHSGRNEAVSRGCVRGFTDMPLGDVAGRVFFFSSFNLQNNSKCIVFVSLKMFFRMVYYTSVYSGHFWACSRWMKRHCTCPQKVMWELLQREFV